MEPTARSAASTGAGAGMSYAAIRVPEQVPRTAPLHSSHGHAPFSTTLPLVAESPLPDQGGASTPSGSVPSTGERDGLSGTPGNTAAPGGGDAGRDVPPIEALQTLDGSSSSSGSSESASASRPAALAPGVRQSPLGARSVSPQLFPWSWAGAASSEGELSDPATQRKLYGWSDDVGAMGSASADDARVRASPLEGVAAALARGPSALPTLRKALLHMALRSDSATPTVSRPGSSLGASAGAAATAVQPRRPLTSADVERFLPALTEEDLEVLTAQLEKKRAAASGGVAGAIAPGSTSASSSSFSSSSPLSPSKGARRWSPVKDAASLSASVNPDFARAVRALANPSTDGISFVSKTRDGLGLSGGSGCGGGVAGRTPTGGVTRAKALFYDDTLAASFSPQDASRTAALASAFSVSSVSSAKEDLAKAVAKRPFVPVRALASPAGCSSGQAMGGAPSSPAGHSSVSTSGAFSPAASSSSSAWASQPASHHNAAMTPEKVLEAAIAGGADVTTAVVLAAATVSPPSVKPSPTGSAANHSASPPKRSPQHNRHHREGEAGHFSAESVADALRAQILAEHLASAALVGRSDQHQQHIQQQPHGHGHGAGSLLSMISLHGPSIPSPTHPPSWSSRTPSSRRSAPPSPPATRGSAAVEAGDGVGVAWGIAEARGVRASRVSPALPMSPGGGRIGSMSPGRSSLESHSAPSIQSLGSAFTASPRVAPLSPGPRAGSGGPGSAGGTSRSGNGTSGSGSGSGAEGQVGFAPSSYRAPPSPPLDAAEGKTEISKIDEFVKYQMRDSARAVNGDGGSESEIGAGSDDPFLTVLDAIALSVRGNHSHRRAGGGAVVADSSSGAAAAPLQYGGPGAGFVSREGSVHPSARGAAKLPVLTQLLARIALG
jgi:hypothetical protein